MDVNTREFALLVVTLLVTDTAWADSPILTANDRSAQEGNPAMTRPLVRFPLRVEYDGSGDKNDAANFVERKQ